MKSAIFRASITAIAACLLAAGGASADSRTYPLEVFPSEHKRMTDERTGAELIFLTRSESRDTNLYFHDQSWLADSSLILFRSDRDQGGVMGYLTATGELVRIATPEGSTRGPTAARLRNSVFVMQGNDVLELALDIAVSDSSAPSRVTATERRIATVPESQRKTALNESSDGAWLSVGLSGFEDGSGPLIVIIHVETGEVRELCRLPEPPGYASHVQWSLTNPHLLSFASYSEHGNDFAGPPRPNDGPNDYVNRRQRLWVVDIRNGVPHNVYHALDDELVTHESWWVDDQMLFSGGTRREPGVEQHVKLLDVYTGQVRVIGAGAWWPQGPSSENAKWSWWHASGSEDGRWIAADNFHGDIMLFEGATTRPHPLTHGHRTYGSGPHLHVGWDRKGEQVVFASDKLGGVNVCIATIPGELQRIVAHNTSGLREASLRQSSNPQTSSPESVYIKMDYMKLTESTPREYFELELGEWRAIHEQRIRAGVTTAWYFYERMPGAPTTDDQPYDYITISVFDDYDKMFSEAGTQAIFQVYPGAELHEMYDRADRARSFVRTDIWKLEAVHSPYTSSKPVSEYLTINYFDTRNGSGKHLELETGVWAGIHRERIRRDTLNSGAVLILTNPEGEPREYDYATIDYYDRPADLRVPLDTELIRAAHPGKSEDDVAQMWDHTEAARIVYKSQLWRLIDAVDAAALEDE